jgi:hypothetical protein
LGTLEWEYQEQEPPFGGTNWSYFSFLEFQW